MCRPRSAPPKEIATSVHGRLGCRTQQGTRWRNPNLLHPWSSPAHVRSAVHKYVEAASVAMLMGAWRF